MKITIEQLNKLISLRDMMPIRNHNNKYSITDNGQIFAVIESDLEMIEEAYLELKNLIELKIQ